MYKERFFPILFFLVTAMGYFGNSTFAEQPKSLAQLLDEFMLDRQSRTAETAVSNKIYEMNKDGEIPDEATISKIAALLDSPDEQIAYAGASFVVALGPRARSIRMDVWKLYFRIIDKEIKICGVNIVGERLGSEQECFNSAFAPNELRFRICSALVVIGDMPSDEKLWFRCAGLSN